MPWLFCWAGERFNSYRRKVVLLYIYNSSLAKRFHSDMRLTLLLPYHPAERPIPTPDGFDSTFYPLGMESVPLHNID